MILQLSVPAMLLFAFLFFPGVVLLGVLTSTHIVSKAISSSEFRQYVYLAMFPLTLVGLVLLTLKLGG
jgi:hypothetical protein